MLVVVGQGDGGTLGIEMVLALDASTILADKIAVESGLGRVLSSDRAGFVPLLEDVVREGIPKEISSGNGSLLPPVLPQVGIVGHCLANSARKQDRGLLIFIVPSARGGPIWGLIDPMITNGIERIGGRAAGI